jgi:hypothetical protein
VNVDADLENVGNTDNSEDNSVAVDADLENVGNTDNSQDNSVEVDATLENVANTITDESVTVGDIDTEFTNYEDNIVIEDNQVEIESDVEITETAP